MRTSLQLCNEHLTKLYRAIASGDIETVTDVEHELTPSQLCVACAYTYKAQGKVKQVLSAFLKHEGYLIPEKSEPGGFAGIKFWGLRLGLFGLFFGLYYVLGAFVKIYTFISTTFTLGSFGVVGVFILSMATFVFVEYQFLE